MMKMDGLEVEEFVKPHERRKKIAHKQESSKAS